MNEVLYQIMGRHRVEPLPERKPSWLKVKAPSGPNYLRLKQMMRELDLHSVCEEARCHVDSGPLVRSRYHAWEQVQAAGG